MRRFILSFLLIGVLTVLIAGCGGNQEKGINSGKDRPKPAEKSS